MNHIKGDLLESFCYIIAHGCNTQGVMGAGVAKQIKRKYPLVYKDYKNICKEKPDNELLGKVFYVKTKNKVIANCFTQQYYGSKHKEFNYESFKICMEKLISDCSKGNVSLALPRIGAGLGKGNWTRIASIIVNLEIKYDYEVFLYTL